MPRRISLCGPGLLSLLVLLTACPEGDGSGPPDASTDPGNLTPFSVSGTVLDTRGEPLEGATVIIEPSITKGAIVLTTKADGTYRAERLLDTVYTVNAWKRVDYRGEQYCLRLGMPRASDYEDFNVRNGAVRDFRWQLTGPIENAPDSTWYFGGLVRLDLTGDFGDGSLELTFTPTHTLLDGSVASTITRTLAVGGARTLEVKDLPVSTYAVSGALVQGEDRRAVHIGTSDELEFEDQSVTASLAFHPQGDCVDLNGVDQPYLFVNSPDGW